VRGQKETCEKVLGLALARDSNANGLLECMTDSHTEGKGSDWIDVVWASFDNGFINAEMYNALLLWADVEDALADREAAEKYRAAALRIMEAFNKPIAEGGLWNPEKGWYAYWRDKDGSVHGDNFVTPVNLMAVAFGLCDDPKRKASILDQLETAMEKENLFFWPLCVYSYQPDEAQKVNWPFPNYENGDIFLAWGEVGMRAYAAYKPEIAVKYLKNVLNRYDKDGLAFQRYRRTSQAGEGDDILANNIQPVTGLYRDIYGIQPKYNRLCLEPHITPDLAGTQVNYLLRGRSYQITLGVQEQTVAVDQFQLRAQGPLGVNVAANMLEYFTGDSKIRAMAVVLPEKEKISANLVIESWTNSKKWTVTADKNGEIRYIVAGLQPGTKHVLSMNGKELYAVTTDSEGAASLHIAAPPGEVQAFSLD
jgi:hypothetical protein